MPLLCYFGALTTVMFSQRAALASSSLHPAACLARMGIDVERVRYRRAPQHVGDNLWIHPTPHQESRCGVTKIMKANARQAAWARSARAEAACWKYTLQ